MQGTQGVVLPVLEQMGRQCPVGAEIDLLVGLEKFYPTIRNEPQARDALLRGLGERYATS